MKKILSVLIITATIVYSMYAIIYEAVKQAQIEAVKTTENTSFLPGSAVTGVMNQIATTSTMGVGPTGNKTLFTENTVCSSRVISTLGQAIMLTFGSTTTYGISPSGTVGHVQAASTTVAYDSGIYGCGTLTAYGFSATTSITISEYR